MNRYKFATAILLFCISIAGCSHLDNVTMRETTAENFSKTEQTDQITELDKINFYETETDKVIDYNSLILEWEAARNTFANGNYTGTEMLSFSFYNMSPSDCVKAYYALYDIDGNGTQELILRKVNSHEDIIAYIFTTKDSESINLFGYDDQGAWCEVPWSRVGSSNILSNGLIDSINGDYAIYKIDDSGFDLRKIVSREPYDYPDEANLALAKWRYYADNTQVDYDDYIQHLEEHGYAVNENNTLASIDWIELGIGA